jgi:hypothetical protein
MLSFFKKEEKPYPGEVDEAKKNPNGWVYRMGSSFRKELENAGKEAAEYFIKKVLSERG